MTKRERDLDFLTNLHTYSDEVRITTEQLAMMLQCKKHAIEIERSKGTGMPFEKIGGKVRYRLGTIRNYLKSCERTSLDS